MAPAVVAPVADPVGPRLEHPAAVVGTESRRPGPASPAGPGRHGSATAGAPDADHLRGVPAVTEEGVSDSSLGLQPVTIPSCHPGRPLVAGSALGDEILRRRSSSATRETGSRCVRSSAPHPELGCTPTTGGTRAPARRSPATGRPRRRARRWVGSSTAWSASTGGRRRAATLPVERPATPPRRRSTDRRARRRAGDGSTRSGWCQSRPSRSPSSAGCATTEPSAARTAAVCLPPDWLTWRLSRCRRARRWSPTGATPAAPATGRRRPSAYPRDLLSLGGSATTRSCRRCSGRPTGRGPRRPGGSSAPARGQRGLARSGSAR